MSKTGKRIRELDFEVAIEAWLVNEGGYVKADRSLFDAKLGLDTQTLVAFLKASQAQTWRIIQRFIHLQVEETKHAVTGKIKRKETLIFPRYHQLAATRQLLADTRKHGVGKSYLIQHSAGSGKTNTISWSAHQLASLHGADNQPIFNSVVVISDRRNLDKQLQDNIYQT